MANPLDSYKQPDFLKKGQKVGLVSTARKISRQELEYAIDIITDWGLVPVLGNHIFDTFYQFAGNDQARIDDFQQMLDDPTIKAIICVRGGYGTVRIIDALNFELFLRQPKWIAGFSDITVLHAHLHNLRVCSLHSTMPICFEKDTLEAVKSLKRALFGESIDITLDHHPFNIRGHCKGQIVGGNLSVLYSLMGSSSEIDTNNKILFIEDLDEYLYHIDRMMMSLKRSEKLSGLAGLIVGGMTSMNDNNIPFGKTAEDIIKDCIGDYSFPVCFNFPAGHIKHNLALQLGRYASLKVDTSVSLSYE